VFLQDPVQDPAQVVQDPAQVVQDLQAHQVHQEVVVEEGRIKSDY